MKKEKNIFILFYENGRTVFFLYREEMIRRKRNLLDSFIIPILIAFLNYLTLSYEHVR